YLLFHTFLRKLFRSFFFSSRRRHTIFSRDWSSDVCSSDLEIDGIELARMVQQNNKDIQMVILSGHDNFYYAQTALEIGIFKYLRSEERRVGKECRSLWST